MAEPPHVRPILTIPEPRLRLAARPVRLPDRGIERLVGELFAAMHNARGVGLAANQVGDYVAVAVIDTGEDRAVLINPTVVKVRDEQVDWEGCLSIPNYVAEVRRAGEVIVRAQNVDGRWDRHRGKGLFARALLHETDHLLGRLYVDLVRPEDVIDTRTHPNPPARARS